MKDVKEVIEGRETICYTLKAPPQVHIICVVYNVVMQPLMRIPIK